MSFAGKVEIAISVAASVVLATYALYLAIGGTRFALSNLECTLVAIIGTSAGIAFVVDD